MSFLSVDKIIFCRGRVWETKRFPTGIRRGGFAHSRKTVRFKVYRWNASVYSSVSASRNPDFDLGVDCVDTQRDIGKSDVLFVCQLR